MKDSFITNGLIIGSIIGGIGEIDRLIRGWHTSRYFKKNHTCFCFYYEQKDVLMY